MWGGVLRCVTSRHALWFHAQSGMRQGAERGRSLTRQASTTSLGAVHEHEHHEGGAWLDPFYFAIHA